MAKFTRNSVLLVRKESFEAIESTKRRVDLTSKGWVSGRFAGWCNAPPKMRIFRLLLNSRQNLLNLLVFKELGILIFDALKIESDKHT